MDRIPQPNDNPDAVLWISPGEYKVSTHTNQHAILNSGVSMGDHIYCDRMAHLAREVVNTPIKLIGNANAVVLFGIYRASALPRKY